MGPAMRPATRHGLRRGTCVRWACREHPQASVPPRNGGKRVGRRGEPQRLSRACDGATEEGRAGWQHVWAPGTAPSMLGHSHQARKGAASRDRETRVPCRVQAESLPSSCLPPWPWRAAQGPGPGALRAQTPEGPQGCGRAQRRPGFSPGRLAPFARTRRRLGE